MNRHYVRIFCIGCALSVGVLNVATVQAEPGVLANVATNAASAVWATVKKVLPTKASTIVALSFAGGLTAKTLWTRYVTLRRIDERIRPAVRLFVDQREHPICNWMMGAVGFSTAGQIRANFPAVRAALSTACLAGELDIFQYATGVSLTAGHPIYWADVLSSIDNEMAHIRGWMRSLESFLDISFRGVHLFGIRRNFVQACDELGIGGFDQMRHALTVRQEEQIDALMTEDRGLVERAIAFLMANPNYDKAHLIFWELDQRLGRLQAIKEAVVHTPVNWHMPLH